MTNTITKVLEYSELQITCISQIICTYFWRQNKLLVCSSNISAVYEQIGESVCYRRCMWSSSARCSSHTKQQKNKIKIVWSFQYAISFYLKLRQYSILIQITAMGPIMSVKQKAYRCCQKTSNLHRANKVAIR